MDRRHVEWLVASSIYLLAVLAVFHDYLPFWKRVHIWSDTEGFHWPLLQYAHRAFQEGRFPLWDPSIYCGIPFAGNIQAGLFYPPNWLLFIANALRSHIPYQAVEILAFAHVWFASVMGAAWLRLRTVHWLPALLGGASVGFSGYMLSQLTHLGMISGYAWIPFGLWGIQQANDQSAQHPQAWRLLWKPALAIAMVLLAGYPAMAGVAGLVFLAYAAALPRRLPLLVQLPVALGLGLLLTAVQVLPVLDTVSVKVKEIYFGAQLPDHPRFYLSFLLPHLYDHNRTQPGVQIWEHDYMYLGATALLGFLVLLARPSRSAILPVLTLLAALLLVLENPYSFISDAVRAVPALPDALRTYNFISGLAFVGALCAAAGVDALLRFGQPARPSPWLSRTWGLLVILWSGYLLFVARQGGPQFVVGLASAWYAIVAVVLVGSGIWLMRAHRSAGMVALLLLLVFTEFRVFGVNRRSNAVTGDIDAIHAMDARAGGPSFVGMDDAVFAHVRRHPDFRIALPDAPATTDMRHYRLATPQGFDPFVNRHLKAIIENHVPFRTNREYDIPPHSHDLLDLLGVGFFIAVKDWETAAILRASPDYELLQPSDSFFQVFARRSARPAWNFEAGTARMVAWEPERRLFSVRSDSGGTLALLEQRLPGWRASVDGLPATTQPWGEAFQAVTVPPGEHLVEFRYFPNSLLWGAAISLLTGLFAVWLLFGKRTPNASVVRT